MLTFKNLPFLFKQYAVGLFIAVLSILAFVFENLISENLIYHRQAIFSGEYWRLITGHLFHTNGFHLLLNLSALFLLWLIHGHFYNLRNYPALLLFTALGTSIALLLFSIDISQYVGLSGVLHGVFVWGAMMDIHNKEKTGYLLFIGVWLKIAHEQIYGASEDVTSLINANVAIDAHLWGALFGMLFAFFSLYFFNSKKTT